MNDLLRHELSEILDNQVLSVARDILLNVVLHALDVVALLCDYDVHVLDLVPILGDELVELIFRDLLSLQIQDRRVE